MSYSSCRCIVFKMQSALLRKVVVMKNGVFSERISGDRGRALLLFAAILVLLLLIVGLFDGLLGKSGTPAAAIVISVFLFVLVLVLRQYELAVVMMVSAHIYIDWY